MKRKMRYLGYQTNCVSGRVRTWLGYNHEKKCSVIVVFFGTQYGVLTIYHTGSCPDEWNEYHEDINYFHKKYWYPEDLEGETVEIKLKPKEI